MTLPRCFRVFAFFVYRLKNRKVVFASALIVVFTESRCGVNDSGTVFRGNIIHAGYDECVLAFFRGAERHELFVFPVFHVAALEFFENFVFILAENLCCESFCEVEDIAFVVAGSHLNLYIVDVRSDGKRDVGCERPRCCRPCEEILVIRAFFLEFAGKRVYLDHLVALRYFVGRKSRSASRAVRQNLVAFVDEAFVERLS